MVGDDRPAGQCEAEPGDQQKKDARHEDLLTPKNSLVLGGIDYFRPNWIARQAPAATLKLPNTSEL
jgi:hypothetical protein